MAEFKMIIFDCDGVLVDSETLTSLVLIDMLSSLGIAISLNELTEQYVGISMNRCMEMLEDRYQFKFPRNFRADYNEKSIKVLAQDLRPIPYIEEVINQLRLPYCVASNSDPRKVESMLRITGLINYFQDKIYTADLVKNPKPAPDIYLHVAEIHGLVPADCLVIEDTHSGVIAAKSAGMSVVGYAASSPARILLDAGADHVINDMREVLDLVN